MAASPAFALALLAAQAGAAQPAPPPAKPCASALYQGFDFWVGHWDVYPNIKDAAKAPLIAHSKIEKLYGGCVIRENWMPLQGLGGGSINTPDPATGRWQQYWVDNQGSRVWFDGGLVGGKMVLTGFWRGVNGPGKDALIRMSYTRIDADNVRQLGELSTDEGQTWTVSFDFIYRRSKAAN